MRAVLAVLASLAAVAVASPLASRQDSRFTFFPLKTPASGPCDLTVGPDGALWGEDILVNKIFRVDPSSGAVSEYPIPFTTPFSNVTIPGVSSEINDRTALSCAIRNATDGNIYASNGLRNQLVQINPTTKAIRVFEPEPVDPAGNLMPFNDLYSAKDGIYLTQTTGNVFQYFEFATERFTTYEVPTPAAVPLGLYVASTGIVYIAELVGNKILTFDPWTKAIAEYPLPKPLQGPAVIRAEKDGYVYFSLFQGDGLGRICMESHAIELFASDQAGGLGSEDTVDDKGGIWLSYFTADVMARLDSATLKYEYVAFPGTFAAGGLSGIFGDVPPYADVAVNYGPGDAIWFTSILHNEVGRYALS